MKFVTYQDFFTGRLKLRHLVVALTVAEEGSTVAAAEKLYVSQPAITRLVHDLEGIVAAPLFERTPTGMRPTPYAQPLLEHARAALSHIKHAAQHVQELADGDTGVVTIGVHLAGTSVLLPRAIASMKEEKPLVDVIVHDRAPDDLLTQLARGEIDLLLTRLAPHGDASQPHAEELFHERLHDERMVFVCGADNPWRHPRKVALTDLADERWVLPLRSTVLRHELEAQFVSKGLDRPANVVECTSVVTVGALIADSGYVGIVPRTVAGALPGLHVIDVVDCNISSGIGVIRPKDHDPSPATAVMLEHLRRTARTLEDSGAAG